MVEEKYLYLPQLACTVMTVNPDQSNCSILGLPLGSFWYNSVGAAIFRISATAIFTVFVISFKLLKWKEA